MIAIMETMRDMMLTMHSTMSGMFDVMDDSNENATAMGQAFDAAQERRFLLSASGSFPEPGLPARDEFLPVAGRESGSIHHFP